MRFVTPRAVQVIVRRVRLGMLWAGARTYCPRYRRPATLPAQPTPMTAVIDHSRLTPRFGPRKGPSLAVLALARRAEADALQAPTGHAVEGASEPGSCTRVKTHLSLAGDNWAARSHDLSESNIEIATRAPLELGDHARVDLDFATWTFRARVVVIRRRQVLAGCRVTCRFVDLSRGDAKRLGDELLKLHSNMTRDRLLAAA